MRTMRLRRTVVGIGAAAALLTPLVASDADALVVANIRQSCSDVVATYSGSVDAEGFLAPAATAAGSGSGTTAGILPEQPIFYNQFGNCIVINRGERGTYFSAVFFGLSASTTASETGDAFGFFRGSGSDFLNLPNLSSSGDTRSGSFSFAGETPASLGVVPGTHVYTLENGETITLNVAVPLPGPGLLGGLGGARACCKAADRS